MKLVNYGPGEITDRLTILSLKILIGTEKGRSIDHFKTEQAALLQQIRSRTLGGVWFEQVLELAAVNGQLWQAEDDLREVRASLPTPIPELEHVPGHLLARVVRVAIRIQELNDRRAQLITLINVNSGDPSEPEKI